MRHILQVAVAAPAHSDLPPTLSYTSEHALGFGSLVRVTLGKREVLGIVWQEAESANSDAQEVKLKAIEGALGDIAPLNTPWRALIQFAARYYQRSLGEVALAALPPQLRELDATQLAKRLKRKPKEAAASDEAKNTANSVALSAEQSSVIEQFFAEKTAAQPCLLFGSTGSGKTEVYLQSVARVLSEDETAQVLIMVPEINLTPQLQTRFTERFAGEVIATMHSGMTPAQRLKAWLQAHSGQARIILGTRMSIFASMPHLRLIVVDEEHDASYKSQDGARHSARDLAVMRAKLETEHNEKPCKVMLGSATPSLESWQACETGRYQRLQMPSRIGNALLPKLKLADMRLTPRGTLFAPQLIAALQERIARGEQSLVFLNRRGYAPVLACDACGWKCECPHCSAYRVFHKTDRTLRCHHCGHTERVPRACPECGNMDIQPVGRGTQKIEEQLALALGSDTLRPDGSPIVISRIDADTTKHKGELEAQLAQVHAGDVDVLVGTQMITKGHDFRRITLVAAIDADAALFSSDFRAPERLFALLMQAAGRAGRDASSTAAHMWVQTRHPDHPLFASLAKHDYAGFAAQQLSDRTQAQLPPFSFQALLRAEARTQVVAQAFLQAALEAAGDLAGEQVGAFPPVPMSMQRVADVERAQMLLESPSRVALQNFLTQWLPELRALRSLPQCKGLIRFAVDVDPLLI
ncbi:primosomal protein N' [Variovorax sp. PCZ-1]|uniref:replication restart helicase PriA n=1 Tax=Variovorax sp. PCZ-1 TaxID=2835533 RepID=UPI001BD0D5D2|nr:primosomal protein N' [Variovorax sp. PCZ-1]MBS7808234.1 primosomal protein N' [Variovorax sp. PCZ-1]